MSNPADFFEDHEDFDPAEMFPEGAGLTAEACGCVPYAPAEFQFPKIVAPTVAVRIEQLLQLRIRLSLIVEAHRCTVIEDVPSFAPSSGESAYVARCQCLWVGMEWATDKHAHGEWARHLVGEIVEHTQTP